MGWCVSGYMYLPDATYKTAEDLAHPPPAMANRPGTGHYTNTKLANIMWVYALSKRINERILDRGIQANAFDPGLMPGSGLAREYKGIMRFAWFKIFPHVSPQTIIRCLAPLRPGPRSTTWERMIEMEN